MIPENSSNLIRESMAGLAPPPDFTTSQWADAERMLSPEASAKPGHWDTARAPFQREIMDATREKGISRIVFKASSQVGKTEILLNIIGYFIHHDPAPMLAVQPSLEIAEAFSKDRIAPMIRDTPALREKIKDPRSRDSGNTLLHKNFPGGHLTLSGANSASSLASRPVRIVLCDEIDRYPFSAGTEGDPVSLARKRTNNFYNSLEILSSTPTIEGASRIDAAFEESDKRFYNVPCPHCRFHQTLKFEQLSWDLGERREPINVLYLCSDCGKKFDDTGKTEMLEQGHWKATAVSNGIAGFHINELYSPWRRWRQIIAAYLEAKKNTETLKVWTNTCLGETWREKGEAPEWERLFREREAYKIGTVPNGGLFLTAGTDVQKDRLECEVVAWGRDRQSWSVDYITILGDTTKDETWAQLDEVLYRQFERDGGGSLGIRMMGIDTGYNTQSVYNWARKHSISRVLPVKGVDSGSFMIGQPSPVDITIRGKKIRRGMRIWPVGVSMIKSELYAWLGIARPTDANEPFPSAFMHFPQYAEEFFKMLTAEQMVTRVSRRGYKEHEWVKTRDRNEALDCRVYARAAASIFGLDRFTDRQWNDLASSLTDQALTSKKAEEVTSGEGKNSPEAAKPPPKKRKSSFW